MLIFYTQNGHRYFHFLSLQTYMVVNSEGGAYFYPRKSLYGNFAFSMGISRNLIHDKKWEDNIPEFREMGRQYLDVDKYGIFITLTFILQKNLIV